MSSNYIKNILAKFQNTPDNLLPALFEIKRKAKKFDFQTIAEIAAFFNLPKSRVWGAVGFFHVFEIGEAGKINRAKEKAARRKIPVLVRGPLLAKGRKNFGIFQKISGLKPEEIIEKINASGLAGRGGAGFPAGKKWRAVLDAARETGKPPVVICNAYEAEPDVFKDRVLLETNPFLVLEGILIAAKTLGAKGGYVYLNPYYKTALEKIRPALRAAEKIFPDFNLKIFLGGGNYVCGEETALLEAMEGKRGEPRQKPPFPTFSGFFGRPTLINNAETFANVPLIFSGKYKNTKLFCLSGKAAKKSGVCELPAETKINDLIFNFAEAKKSEIGFVQVGGFGGELFYPDELGGKIIASGAAAVHLEPGSKKPAEFSRERAAFFASESCGKCVPCREGTFEISEILKKKKLSEKDEKRLDDLVFALKEASFCAFGPMAAAPVSFLLKSKTEI